MPSHILILGAGAAGLAAARRLAEAGVSFTVLEARATIGGRIRTLRPDDGPLIEAGPEFIHGDAPELGRLLAETRTAAEELPDRHLRRVDGRLQPLDFENLWNVVFERLRTDHGPDRSFAELLAECCGRLTDDERQTAVDYVEGFNAADIRDVGTQWLRRTELAVGVGDEAPIRIVASGFDRVVEALAAGVPDEAFRFRLRAVAVRRRPGAVEVDAATPAGRIETFAGDAVIVTLPVSILKASGPAGLRFEPALPEKQNALDLLRMGTVVKVKLRFDEPFWRNHGAADRGFLHAPGAVFMTWWPLGDAPLLTGWCGGPRCDRLDDLDEQAIVEHAIGDLATALGTERDEVFRYLRAGRAFHWGRDPFALGAYSYGAVGGFDASRQLAKPVDDTLFFAGEATDPEFSATVGGAIRSGRRAADEVLTSRGGLRARSGV